MKLKKCPFCGGKAEWYHDIYNGCFYVFCLKCGSQGKKIYSARIPNKNDRVKAIKAWNTRYDDKNN